VAVAASVPRARSLGVASTIVRSGVDECQSNEWCTFVRRHGTRRYCGLALVYCCRRRSAMVVVVVVSAALLDRDGGRNSANGLEVGRVKRFVDSIGKLPT